MLMLALLEDRESGVDDGQGNSWGSHGIEEVGYWGGRKRGAFSSFRPGRYVSHSRWITTSGRSPGGSTGLRVPDIMVLNQRDKKLGFRLST